MAEQAVPPKKPGVEPKPDRHTLFLEEMRANPKANWKIEDIEKPCRHFGLDCTAPTRGSHYKVSSKRLGGLLTVPYNRPIKPIYIKRFVALMDAHLKAGA